MEEIATVDPQLTSAQFPIGAEQKVIPKQAVFEFTQRSPGHQAEIGDVFFILSAPRARA
ncbi:MAG TPA: hypothetical protein VK419_01630 [Bryobacteraceae bacterium]|nr:hypothetical protein [Bryobacteraceae bacterium]